MSTMSIKKQHHHLFIGLSVSLFPLYVNGTMYQRDKLILMMFQTSEMITIDNINKI